MPVTAKPDGQTGPEATPDNQLATLKRKLKAVEAKLAAETAAREEQEKLARTMARAARSEAAEGEALAQDAAELRSLLKAQQDEHAAVKRELARQQAKTQEIIDAEVTQRLAPELERRLAETRAAWDVDRKRERTQLAETWKRETEQRLADAEAAWREERDNALDETARMLDDGNKQNLAEARKEWEQEHDAAIADRERYWRERLDREIQETRAAMEKIWARAQDPASAAAAGIGLRGMRDRLIVAAHRRRILSYRIAILTLLLAVAAAFAFRYPTLETALSASARPDRTVSAERQPATTVPQPALKPLRPRGVPAKKTVTVATPPNPEAKTQIDALESRLSAMRTRLEAEEKRANDAEVAFRKATAAQKKANTRADRAFRAQARVQSRAIADLEAEIRTLRKKLADANAAGVAGQTPE